MPRFAQAGIIIGIFGLVFAFMGLFPGITGVKPTTGVGLIQVVMLMTGYTLLIVGALIYIKYTFYNGLEPNLAQQIGIRLALTGLLFATISGLADILGFGSHLRTSSTDIFFGQWQAFGLLANLALSSIGVMLYAVAGNSTNHEVLEHTVIATEVEEIDKIDIVEEDKTTELTEPMLVEVSTAVNISR